MINDSEEELLRLSLEQKSETNRQLVAENTKILKDYKELQESCEKKDVLISALERKSRDSFQETEGLKLSIQGQNSTIESLRDAVSTKDGELQKANAHKLLFESDDLSPLYFLKKAKRSIVKKAVKFIANTIIKLINIIK